MPHQTESVALSPLLFGEIFFAGAATMQRQIADGILAVFDAVADALSDSLRASAGLADDISHAETPVEVVAAGYSWFQGRVEKGFAWLRALGERLASRSGTPTPQPQAVLPAPVRRAPVVPQEGIRMPTKPLVGRIRSTQIVVAKAAKKPARPTAK